MVSTILRWGAILASLLVVVSFGAFAVDELRRGSEEQQSKIAGEDRPAPSPTNERERERQHSKARELIDDANDVLLAPFADVTSSDSPWAARGVPALLALVVYGFGLGFLSRWTAGRA